MTKSIRFAVLAISAAMAMSAQAADWYVGGSIGGTNWKADLPLSDKSDTGGKAFVGVGLHPNFAIELGWADLGTAKLAGPPTANLKGDGVFLDLVGRLPLANNFSALARLGAFNGRSRVSGGSSERGTDVKFGLGVAYSVSQAISVRGEWERYRFKLSGVNPDVDLWSLGLVYSF